MDHNDISGIIEDTNGAFTGLENLNKLWVSHVLFYLNHHFSFTFILDILIPGATKTSDIPKILLYILHWIAYYKIMPRFVLLRLNKWGRAGNLNPHLTCSADLGREALVASSIEFEYWGEHFSSLTDKRWALGFALVMESARV